MSPEARPKASAAERIGDTQGFVVTLMLRAEAIGRDRLSMVQLISWMPESTTAEKRKATRLQYRRVCKVLVERGLVEESGSVLSITGQPTGSLSDWIGKRVPKGYSRQTLAFSLTDEGRAVARGIFQALAQRERNFIDRTAQKAAAASSHLVQH